MDFAARVLAAARFAAEAHRDQRRKRTGAPYIIHPLRVAERVASGPLPAGVNREDAILAALLHDVLEDTPTPRDMLERRFGAAVVGVVLELTQDKRLPREERVRIMVAHAGTMSAAARAVKLADRLDNLLEMGVMGEEFIRRYCAETCLLLDALHGGCPELEAEIERVLAVYAARKDKAVDGAGAI
jgi:guanosine-3',5'-bis(diphosphate) 3'-pyrophosphohydrolase